MIWQNPWAWTGLAFLALPVLIHLLGRGQAPRRVFPSLRFLPPSRSLPTRRRRVRDPLLLAVRLGILSAAVIGLAQPRITSKRTRDSARGIARAIIVDTSASMRRASHDGTPALIAARRDAQRLAGEAQTSIVTEAATPRRALAGAVAWIARQHRRAELVIVSDFQTGTIDARDLAIVPRAVGIVLSRIDVAPATDEIVSRAGDVEHVARVTPSATATATDVEWTTRAAAVDRARPNVVILAGTSERNEADAAQRAASTLGARPPFDSTHAVAIVLPGFERRSELVKGATALRAPWMADVVARLRADSTLIAAASMARGMVASGADTSGAIVVARADSGRPAVLAAQGQLDGRDGLLLLPLDAGSLTTAALMAATTRALAAAPPVTEMEPTIVNDDVLRSWQREPGSSVAPQDNATGASDGRWLWIVALALLVLESWLRRDRREHAVSRETHDRAA